MGGRAEIQLFHSPLCRCLGAVYLKRWFNLIIFLWLCNEVIHSQKVPCSDEPAAITHVHIILIALMLLHCQPAHPAPSTSLQTTWPRVQPFSDSTGPASPVHHSRYQMCSGRWGWNITCISTGWGLLPFGSKFLSSSLISSGRKYQQYEDFSWEHFFPNIRYSATQDFSNLGSP